MAHCNLEMDDNCYGCPYYGLGDINGCKLTIKFHKEFPNGDDKQYEQYMLSNGRITIGMTPMRIMRDITATDLLRI